MDYKVGDIWVTSGPVTESELLAMAEARFGDMVKGVIDIDRGVVAFGGELHADQEAVLIQNDHLQEHLWGFNVYIGEPMPDRIEFDSMINIRPRDGNRSRKIDSVEIQTRILSWLDVILNGSSQ